MIKKISTLALAAMLALPAAASAGGSGDLAAQIDRLTRELDQLKQQVAQVKESTTEMSEDLEEKSEKWDLASRFQLSGDFRTKIDYVDASTTGHWEALNLGHGIADWNTTGAVMARYSGLNAAATYGNFAVAFAGAGFGGPAGSGYNSSTGQITTTADNALTITDLEAAAIGRVFGSATVQGIVGRLAAARLDGSDGQGGTTTFTNLQALTTFMKNGAPAAGITMSPAVRNAIFSEMGYGTTDATDYGNDTIWTNRLRINMRVKATEDLEFKGRLAMYKAWGMQNNPVDYTANAGLGGGPYMLNSLSFDGSTTRQPTDNILRVDRGFMNWNNIGGQPIWFSIGRRPTTDGPPAQLRLGADKKMATPVAYMDYPFDGFSLGYAYSSLFGIEDFPGRVRFCYGRGFESGPTENAEGLKDVDFGGLSWDVYHSGDRFFNFQSFVATDMFNVPDNITFPNPVEFGKWLNDPSQFDPTDSTQNLILDRVNLGNIFHTSAVFMDKQQDLNYFLVGGWSRTDARGMDELGTSLLGSFFDSPSDKDGYSVYAGLRYDIPDQPFKIGIEYNYGSKNWISFTPGNDDLYAAKLATRGHVVEAYTIWNLPAGEAVSKFGRAFVRLGYQHYEYNYTGSGFWLGEPLDVDDLVNDPLSAQFYTPVDSQDQVYLSMEAWF